LGFGNSAEEDTGITTGLKLSLFDVSNEKEPKELDNFKIGDKYLSAEMYSHKDLMIDTEKKLIGFSYRDYRRGDRYTVFSYHNYKFTQLLDIIIEKENDPAKNFEIEGRIIEWEGTIDRREITGRGLMIEDYLYISNDKKIISIDKNYHKIGTLKYS
jgi:uncharacterized secreted protein with C-terminal beta-propeller domain